MSSFIVEPKTISKIVNYIDFKKHNLPLIMQKLAGIGIMSNDNNFKEQLFQALFELNIEGVKQRYGEDNYSDMLPEGKFKFDILASASDIATYKALQCLIYQCSEGDVPETELYKILDQDLSSYLANDIIYKLPEYDKAMWE